MDTASERDIEQLLARWYDDGEEAALRLLVDVLVPRTYFPKDIVRWFSSSDIDDLRQEVLIKALNRKHRLLAGRVQPQAYVRRMCRNKALDHLRKLRARRWEDSCSIDSIDANHPALVDDAPPHSEEVSYAIDAEFAVSLFGGLSVDRRLALLLTLRPSAITPVDWEVLCRRHPPPPPERPDRPLDREDASELLYGVSPGEGRKDRRKRLERFRKTLKRAHDDLRVAFQEEDDD